MAERHPREQALRRVHGTGALFAAAYGNVGSSIYYALGVVALYALGLTPVTFVIAGLIFAFTAASYAEAHRDVPGGRRLVELRAPRASTSWSSFFAAWGADAHLHRHDRHLGVLRAALPRRSSGSRSATVPGTSSSGSGWSRPSALLNIRGTEESARLNLVLAIADLLTQIVLVVIGIALVLDTDLLVSQIELGTAPSWGDFALGIAVGMVAYTGIETISNMAEEAKDAARTIPRGVGATVMAVIGLYALLPAIALSAMPVTAERKRRVHDVAGHRVRGRPGARASSRTWGSSAGLTNVARGLRRDPGRGDPADRHERRADRGLAADVLDGAAPPAAGAPAAGAPEVQDALRGDPDLLGLRRAHDRARRSSRS